jgi:hypothetical protein
LASEPAFHQNAELADRFLALLEHKANRGAALAALFDVRGEVMEWTQAAALRYESFLDYLRKIAAGPLPPPKRKRGKPRTAKDLRELIAQLADCWKRATGKPFHQTNRSRSFAILVVELIDHARLKSLPTVMKTIVSARRKIL